jgi:hypothetical protein
MTHSETDLMRYGLLALITLSLLACSSTSLATPPPTPDMGLANPLAPTCTARQVNAADEQAWEPDQHCTPGAMAPGGDAITCTVKWTRPPTDYTNALKRVQLGLVTAASYHLPEPYQTQLNQARIYSYPGLGPPYVVGARPDPRYFEEDHLLPGSWKGDPALPANLWPEPHATPNEKDGLETNRVYIDSLCADPSGRKWAQARQGIMTDWYAAWIAAGRPRA